MRDGTNQVHRDIDRSGNKEEGDHGGVRQARSRRRDHHRLRRPRCGRGGRRGCSEEVGDDVAARVPCPSTKPSEINAFLDSNTNVSSFRSPPRAAYKP